MAELALVAHELGNALAPVRNAVDLVHRGESGPLQPEQEKLLGIAARGLERSTRVLQNLTALAAPLEAYRPERLRIDPAQLLQRLCADFEAEAASRGVRLESATASTASAFLADPLCLEQVLSNLITNALKFTPAGGTVRLGAEAARTVVLPGRLALLAGGFGIKPRFVCFEVRDTGVGLSSETRRRLFEPFYRGPEAELQRVAGMGLGLTVARRLAGLLHGDLRADPGVESGARFLLTLPADDATLGLVERLDAALADLGPRLAAGPQTLAVLRSDPAFGGLTPADLENDLRARLNDARTCLLPLGETTWVACTAQTVRALLRALAAALATPVGSEPRATPRVHAQRTARGATPDACLLQSLVRCRRPLAAPSAVEGEVLDAAHPARR